MVRGTTCNPRERCDRRIVDRGRWFFFFQAEDGIRDYKVTGVQTCALPIYLITWLWGLPTSSSHALIGGLVGASALAAGPGSILLPSATNMLLFVFVTGMADRKSVV